MDTAAQFIGYGFMGITGAFAALVLYALVLYKIVEKIYAKMDITYRNQFMLELGLRIRKRAKKKIFRR